MTASGSLIFQRLPEEPAPQFSLWPIGMKNALDGFGLAIDEIGQGGQTGVDGSVNGTALGLAGFFQHIIDHFVFITRVADADTQAVEVGTEFGLDVFEAVVATIATALFKAQVADWDVEFIMCDQDAFNGDFVKLAQGLYALA